MFHIPKATFFCFLSSLALLTPLQAQETPAGFEKIFNGQDLTGWKGSDKYWSVEEGALIGKADGSLKYNRFIISEVEPVRNFELRVKVKVSPGGNSGIQYRSKTFHDLGDTVLTGYQCDVVSNRPEYNGMLYEEKERRILARTGKKVIIDTEGQPWVVGTLPVKTFPAGEWHDFRILAKGNHLQHWIDGQQTIDVIDLDEKGRDLAGLLGVQVHVGPPMTIQYKDFYLKRLSDKLPLITAAEAPIPKTAVQVVPQGGGKKERKPEK